MPSSFRLLTKKEKLTFDRIKKNIQSYVRRRTGGVETYHQWKCGIGKNPDDRIGRHLNSHNLDEIEYMEWDTSNPEISKQLEYYFHQNKMQGGMSPGNWKQARFIYVFLLG